MHTVRTSRQTLTCTVSMSQGVVSLLWMDGPSIQEERDGRPKWLTDWLTSLLHMFLSRPLHEINQLVRSFVRSFVLKQQACSICGLSKTLTLQIDSFFSSLERRRWRENVCLSGHSCGVWSSSTCCQVSQGPLSLRQSTSYICTRATTTTTWVSVL